MWQDTVLAWLNVVFMVTLVPMLVQGTRPPLATSVTTALGLATGSVTLATLGLWWASSTEGIVALQWAYMAARSLSRSPTD